MVHETARLTVTLQAYESMLAHFRGELPREGCGFLAGGSGLAHRFYGIQNTSPELRRFSMDPRHVQRTEISIRRRSQRILAVCHSHPDGEAYPSTWDVAGAFFDPQLSLPLWMEEVHVIALMDPPDSPEARAFFIKPGGVIEEVALVVDPARAGGE